MKKIRLLVCCMGINICQAQQMFDIALAQNIIHTDVSIDEGGVGVCFFDFDNDGWDDLTFIKQNDSLVLYKNTNGIFHLLPASIATPGEPKQAIWVDYDNNGFNDLLISFMNAPCRLYHNDGNFNFTDVTLQSGLSLLASPNNGVSFGDYNKDGFLDLYICRYSLSGQATNADELNALYKNNGNGTFSNVADQAGVSDGIHPSFQAVWLDYNKDGWSDLYVINDGTGNINSLYKNNGDGTFTNVTLPSGTSNSGANPMTNSVADFDNDGDLDIFMAGKGGVIDVGRLLVNNNDGTFTEAAQAHNLAIADFLWGAVWVDLNNDAYQDLIIASDLSVMQLGNYELMSNNATNFILSNQNFINNSIASSRSVAHGDIGNDGIADIVVSNRAPYNSFLWKNQGTVGNNYTKITLQGTVSNKMAIGAWVSVCFNGECLTKYTLCGENYMGQNSQHYIFGIGNSNLIDSIIIQYPSGVKDKYTNVVANTHNHFIEGETQSNTITYNTSLTFCEGDSIVLDAGDFSSYLWSNGSNTRYLTVFQSGLYWVDVSAQGGLLIYSDTLTIEVSNTPQISINAQNISCTGLSDGSITLDIVNATNSYNIQWNQNLQGDSLTGLAAGNYVYEYSDIFGCMATDSISIYSPFALIVNLQITPYSLSGYGSINSIINGGTSPYNVYLDGDLQSQFIDSLLPGNYLYKVIDANGCVYSNNITIVDQTLVGLTVNNKQTLIYENPMIGGELQIKSLEKIRQIKVYNTLGQLITSSFENNTLHLNDDYYGLIYLTVITEQSQQHIKILKQ